MQSQSDAIVIGGGIIGLAAALELSRRGFQVTVVEKGEPFREASMAAAGMLGAHVEIHQEGPLFELCKASLSMYRSWTDSLFSQTGISPHYIGNGLLRVAFDEEDERELRGRLPWIGPYEWLGPDEIQRLEPATARDVRGGLLFQDDHQIHPVHLGKALEAAVIQSGCRVLKWTTVHKLLSEGSRITGVQTSQGPLYAGLTIAAAGAWSVPLLAEVGVSVSMMPVKGQCIAVRPEKPLLNKTVFTRGCYMVPRMDGTITIGATQLEAGFDKTATLAGIAELYGRASRMIPAISGAAFQATWSGLRPGTRDGLPYLGPVSGLPGLLLATGHYRNGILLAPVTAAVIGQLAAGERPQLDLSPFCPERTDKQHN